MPHPVLMVSINFRRTATTLAFIACAVLTLAVSIHAQETPQKPPAPVRVFIDCQNASCDCEYFRTAIAFVDHVRDWKDANVHVLITGQTTGSGGSEYSLTFIGFGRFQGVDATMVYAASVDATSDLIRKAFVQHLALGRNPRREPASPVLRLGRRPPQPHQRTGDGPLSDTAPTEGELAPVLAVCS